MKNYIDKITRVSINFLVRKNTDLNNDQYDVRWLNYTPNAIINKSDNDSKISLKLRGEDIIRRLDAKDDTEVKASSIRLAFKDKDNYFTKQIQLNDLLINKETNKLISF